MAQTYPLPQKVRTVSNSSDIIEFCVVCHRAKGSNGEWLYMDNHARTAENVHNGFCEDCASLWMIKKCE